MKQIRFLSNNESKIKEISEIMKASDIDIVPIAKKIALDIKLRSDMLGKTILYIGYSLEDINMRFLLYKLSKIWEKYKDIRPASYIFLTKPNEVEEKILESRGVKPIISDFDNPGEGLIYFFDELVK